MPGSLRALQINDRQGQTLFRALLEYQRILKYSEISGLGVVAEELGRVQDLMDRISLATFYPAEEFQKPQDGDWAHVDE